MLLGMDENEDKTQIKRKRFDVKTISWVAEYAPKALVNHNEAARNKEEWNHFQILS